MCAAAAKRCADAALGMDGECRSALLVHVALFDYAGENSKAVRYVPLSLSQSQCIQSPVSCAAISLTALPKP